MPRSLLLVLPLVTLIACSDSSGLNPAPGETSNAGGAAGASAPATRRGQLPEKIEELQPLFAPGDLAQVDDMTTTPSGLRFRIVRSGGGDELPPEGAVVLVHHSGWVVDGGRLGRQISDSRAGRTPERMLLAASTRITNVTAGYRNPLEPRPPRPVHLQAWIETLRDMRPGERRWIVAPSELAWGSLGYPPTDVAPDTDVAFDIELVSFEPPRP